MTAATFKKIDIGSLEQLLANLISIPSVNPTLDDEYEGEKSLSTFIINFLKDMGLEVQTQKVCEGRQNVIGILKGTGKGKSLMFNGHMDTVDVANMTIEPFEPEVRDGKMYGRGSLDMKGGLAAMTMAVKSIVDSGIRPAGDVLLTYVIDEEYSSFGTEALAKEFKADAAIVCEPTNLELNITHRGFVWEKVTVHGVAAHGSRSDEGVDAIVKAGKFLVALETMEKEELYSKTHPLLGHPSVHASLISGGTGISTYPDSCVIEIERRTIPGETKETVSREMRELIDKLEQADPDFKADLELYFERSPLELSRDEPIIKSMEKAFYGVTNRPAPLKGFSGWADSALLNDAGIPAVLFGPSGKGLHASEEYVDLNSVLQAAEILRNTIVDFCGI